MTDYTTERGAPDVERVNMTQEHEVQYWMLRFGVRREDLKRAVEDVGPMAQAVEARLRGRYARPERGGR